MIGGPLKAHCFIRQMLRFGVLVPSPKDRQLGAGNTYKFAQSMSTAGRDRNQSLLVLASGPGLPRRDGPPTYIGGTSETTHASWLCDSASYEHDHRS